MPEHILALWVGVVPEFKHSVIVALKLLSGGHHAPGLRLSPPTPIEFGEVRPPPDFEDRVYHMERSAVLEEALQKIQQVAEEQVRIAAAADRRNRLD